jgi:phosphoglycerol transferase MdoB-like AlkP superfamily enzyme
MVEIRTKPALRKFSDRLTRAVSSSRSSFALFVCLFVMVLVYRMQLTIGLFMNRVKPFDFHPGGHPFWFALAYLPYDLAVVLICSLICWLLSRVTHLIKVSKGFPVLKVSGMVLLQIVLLGLVVIHGVHGRLLFDVQTGIDRSVIQEAFSGISAVETVKLTEARDYLFLFFPFAIFWLVFLSSIRLRVWMVTAFVLLAISLLSLSLFAASGRAKNVPDEIRLNPALFLLSDVTEDVLRYSPSGRNMDIAKGVPADIHPLRFKEDYSVESKNSLPAKSKHPWNVIFFVMESVGTRYIFDTSNGNRMPMPFLRKISQEGWYLKRHFTTSNVSTKAIFSLFSGRYDFFNRETFGTRPDADVPSIYHWLGEGYDRFLVTPSSISWYFPTKFVKNNGPREIHSYENLKFKIKEEFHSLGHYIARDEIQTVDFFIQRLSKAKEPFLGTYISFAAHFPYFDYGEDYRVVDDGRLISRYYNNLSLLDCMIQRIMDHLQAKGLLERTILVIVGDHGQAFGQHHPNNYMHYRYSYNENLETPAILYQPALFKPRVFGFPTSHVDLLPTLLDALRIPYVSTAFDGESLFNRKSRKTMYFYGYEESFSSLDSHLIKVQYSLKKKNCWAFDLKRDPDEKNPMDCSLYPLQQEDLHRFVSEHDASLLRYTGLKEKIGVQAPQAPAGRETSSSR